jgi:hypothetical protein
MAARTDSIFLKKQTFEREFVLFAQENSLHDSMSARLISKCLFALEFQVSFEFANLSH